MEPSLVILCSVCAGLIVFIVHTNRNDLHKHREEIRLAMTELRSTLQMVVAKLAVVEQMVHDLRKQEGN